MALELFKPFVMKRLVDTEIAQNIKSAKRMVERRRTQVWDVLDEVIKEHPVFLNRAPTLAPPRHPGLRADPRRRQGHPDPPARLRGLQRRLRRRPDGRAPAAVGRGPGRGARADALGEQHLVAGDGPPDHRPRPGHGLRRLLPDAHGGRGQGRGPRLPPPLRGRAGLGERRRRPARQDQAPPGPGRLRVPAARALATATTRDAVEEPAELETTPGRLFFNRRCRPASGT